MKTLFLWIFSLCWGFSFASKGDTLRLTGAYNGYLPDYLRIKVDCSKDASFEQLLEQFKNGEFERVNKGNVSNVVNIGVTDCNHWFALVVKNESEKPEDYLWGFYNDGIQFTLYEINKGLDGFERKERLSHSMSRAERQVPLRSLSYRISMQPGESKLLLVKTELVGRNNLYFPTDISTETDILWWELDYSFLLGRYFGFFFFAAIFNFILFIILRKKFYGMMMGYLLSLIAFNLIEYLHDLYLIPGWLYPFWSKIPKEFFLGLILIFNIKVFQNFINLKKSLPKLNRILEISVSAVLVISMLYFLIFTSGWVADFSVSGLKLFYNAILILLVGIFLFCIFIAVRNKINYVWHYLGGNILLFASLIIYLLNHNFPFFHLKQFIMPGNLIFSLAFEIVYLMIIFMLKYKKDFDEFSRSLIRVENERKLLTEELISVQEKERMRIAQDIHDGIGGAFQAFRFLLSQENLKNGDKLQSVLKEINSDFKQLIHRLSPKGLQSHGLFKTIEADALIYEDVPKVELNLIGDESLIPLSMKINLYRIYQELFTNALKHANQLTHVYISIAVDTEDVRLMVEDNGSQQVNSTLFQSSDGHGLSNIRSRIAYYKGDIHIHSSITGTTIIVNLPFPNT
ncbi:ATP-binding protein [Moheibacter lacus]|uniref:histidine kinase n=1 Tax=Moheibacter lacus TaxID=2745851 RepID=A0A838ZSZ1_9FLAO|nr:ATP-binding protein [Moheibacter lacus]MBA5630069.1 hypothetical protein [Moheibacter lacus]